MTTIEDLPFQNEDQPRFSGATQTTFAQKCYNEPNCNLSNTFHRKTTYQPYKNTNYVDGSVIKQHSNYGNFNKSICRRDIARKISTAQTETVRKHNDLTYERHQPKSSQSNLKEESRNKEETEQEESIVGKDGIEEQEGGTMSKNISTSPDKNVIEKSLVNQTGQLVS